MRKKRFGAVMKKTAIAFSFILALLIPSMTNAQITSSYGRDSGVNPAAFTLTIYSPNNQTVYANTMLLNFNITWTTYPKYYYDFVPPLTGEYAYSIDDNPLVSIASNQSANDLFYSTPEWNFTINPSFSYLVNVSNLTNGYHKILIKASLYYGNSAYSSSSYFNESSIPTLFLVQNPAASPTPESEPLPATLIVASIVLVAFVGVDLLVYFKKRKH